MTSTKVFYWITFSISILILPQNFGLGLIALGLFIIPILLLHLMVGLGASKLENHKIALTLSALNLLLFVLIRPDGAHAFTDTGLTSVLEYFGVYIGNIRKYENELFFGSIFLLVLQLIIDGRLLKIMKKTGKGGY